MVKSSGLVVALLLAGCADEGAWVGTYTVNGTWRLSGPLEGGRTVGDAASELLVDELSGALPAPSFVEDEVHDWLEGAIGGKVKTAVDSSMPPELAPNGSLTRLLAKTLAAVDIDSTLRLDGEAGGELEGTETVTAIEYVIKGQSHRVSASKLAEGAETGIGAEWSGQESETGRLSIDPHSVTIRYGALVLLVVGDLLQASELSALNAKMKTALGCTAIVSAMLGGGSGLKISVAGWSHTIGKSELESACSSAMALIEKKALGQFELDSKVEVGGTVLWSEVPPEGSIKLESAAGFGGVVNVLPKAIAPKVSVSFTGVPAAQD